MKVRNILALLLLCAVVQTVSGQTMTVNMKDGSQYMFIVPEVEDVVFSEDGGTIFDEHGWVDLGLPSGTLWATCNVGAGSPEEYGDYFAWGETQPKDIYRWDNYQWMTAGQASWSYINKYTFSDRQTGACWFENGVFVGDNKTLLEAADDVATANWGSEWQMPSPEQVNELINDNYTTSVWTEQGGVLGYRITSLANGNSIFLPAAGYREDAGFYQAGTQGCYWTRSLSTSYADYATGYYLHGGGIGTYENSRHPGFSVRPVRVSLENEQQRDWVDLGLPSGTLWATCNVGAGSPEEYGDFFAWGETKPKDYYDEETYKWMNAGQSSRGQYNKYTFADINFDACWYSNKVFVGDGKTQLDSADDAATANWGSDWQMPSMVQIHELINDNYTISEWTQQNGVSGYRITSRSNGKSIFLPAASSRSYDEHWGQGLEGWYLSRSLATFDSKDVGTLYFSPDIISDEPSDVRHFGCTIRPVRTTEHGWVDLGLPSGTKWATCNVGAYSPEEFGCYYAWGETEPKSTYAWSTYKWYNGSGKTKYCTNSSHGYNGFTDGKTELEPADDAATANWGEPWHMPTSEQIDELRAYCTFQFVEPHDNWSDEYILVTGPNGGQIILPTAGYYDENGIDRYRYYGFFWSSSSVNNRGVYLSASKDGLNMSNYYEYVGHTVRPVRP